MALSPDAGPGRDASPRILILTASAGNGHLSAARALEQRFNSMGATVRTVDALDCAPRAYRQWFCGGYEGLVRHSPALWGRLYRWADRPGPIYAVQTAMDDRFLGRLGGLVRSARPDWVVCTHSLPQPRLARLRAVHPTMGVAIVVTDIHPHLMWLRGFPDRFFVPVERTKALLEARRPGSAAITEVTGIPVAHAFAHPVARPEARARLGWEPDERAVLMTSGGIGGGPLTDALLALAAVEVLDRLILVCGRNPNALQRCRSVVGALPESRRRRVQVVGQLPQPEFALLMAASSMIVGKPGGLTMSECLATGRALMIYAPLLIPGQEEGNAEYLVAEGCGVAVGDARSLTAEACSVLGDVRRLAQMEAAARRIARPDAAGDIARALLGAMEDRLQGLGSTHV
jgi:processive 1,2-diacylglycerol beta-glucosyltransferase